MSNKTLGYSQLQANFQPFVLEILQGCFKIIWSRCFHLRYIPSHKAFAILLANKITWFFLKKKHKHVLERIGENVLERMGENILYKYKWQKIRVET